ncbi:hypothetical protein A5780_27085 [Nocardia sp. 852002-20019_SCH5090214]|nr:hypothetical protein A5780_27085 [Nocardia sp. 852002-20019_SCH5090214]
MGAVHVVGGEVGQSAAALVFGLDPHRPPSRGPEAAAEAVTCLDTWFLISGEHVVVRAEWFVVPDAGIQVQRPSGLDLGDLLRGERAGTATARQIDQPIDPIAAEPFPPLAGRVGSDREGAGDTGIRLPGRCCEHDPRPQHLPHRCRGAAGDRFQLRPLAGGQDDNMRTPCRHSAVARRYSLVPQHDQRPGHCARPATENRRATPQPPS